MRQAGAGEASRRKCCAYIHTTTPKKGSEKGYVAKTHEGELWRKVYEAYQAISYRHVIMSKSWDKGYDIIKSLRSSMPLLAWLTLDLPS